MGEAYREVGHHYLHDVIAVREHLCGQRPTEVSDQPPRLPDTPGGREGGREGRREGEREKEGEGGGREEGREEGREGGEREKEGGREGEEGRRMESDVLLCSSLPPLTW